MQTLVSSYMHWNTTLNPVSTCVHIHLKMFAFLIIIIYIFPEKFKKQHFEACMSSTILTGVLTTGQPRSDRNNPGKNCLLLLPPSHKCEDVPR